MDVGTKFRGAGEFLDELIDGVAASAHCVTCPQCGHTQRIRETPTFKLTPETPHTFEGILALHGSFRRLTEAYWLGRLAPEHERILEERVPKETLGLYRPVMDDAR